MQQAISVIKAEHRSLAAVLHGLLAVIDDLLKLGGKADFRVLRAMLDYIDRYPDRFHHPKEDQYLFRLLRLRAVDAVGLLDSLEAEHRKNIDLMGDLRRALQRFEETPGDPARLTTLQTLVRQYAEFHWSHMRIEEEQVFPLAISRLLPEDWQEIDAAFCHNEDPLFGMDAKREYDELLRRIVAIAPAPIGTGAAWR